MLVRFSSPFFRLFAFLSLLGLLFRVFIFALLRKGRSLRWVSREGTLCLLCLHHEDIIKQLQLVRTLLIVTHSASLP